MIKPRITIVGQEEVQQALRSYGKAATEVIREWLRFWSARLMAEARQRLDRNAGDKAGGVDTGTLQRSITWHLQEEAQTITAKVGTNLWYARYVHQGSPPHWVPTTATGLMAWIRRHGLEDKLVRRQGLWVKGRFVPFARAPGLLAWATRHNLVERQAVKIRARPRRFLTPLIGRFGKQIRDDLTKRLRLLGASLGRGSFQRSSSTR